VSETDGCRQQQKERSELLSNQQLLYFPSAKSKEQKDYTQFKDVGRR
jgi:hypothetical protein